MVRKLAVVLVTSLALTGNAWAASISFSTVFDLRDSEVLETSGDASGHYFVGFFDLAFLTLPRFNSSLGVLQNVSIGFETHTRTRLQSRAEDHEPSTVICPIPPFFMCDFNDTSHSATVVGGFRAELFDPGTSFFSRSLLDTQFCEDHEDFKVAAACISPEQDNVNPFNFGLPLTGAGIGLTQFVGTDPIHLFVLLDGSVAGTCDHNDGGDLCTVFAALEWSGNVTVNYTFAELVLDPDPDPGPDGPGDPVPVPEPTSLLLLGAGAASLLATARRRKKQQGHRAPDASA